MNQLRQVKYDKKLTLRSLKDSCTHTDANANADTESEGVIFLLLDNHGSLRRTPSDRVAHDIAMVMAHAFSLLNCH